MSLRRRWLPILLAGVFVVVMVALSGILRCPEVLFPETAAILCGAWIQPTQAWNVDRRRMIGLMCAGSVFGLAVNLLLPWPLWLRAPLGYLFCAVAMNVVGADMTPMLSAAILPMVLGTREWAYPVAVTTIVCLVCLGQVKLEQLGLREKIDYHTFRLAPREAFVAWGRRLLVFCVLACPAFATGNAYLAVPPLLVAYTELTRPDMTLRLRPRRTWCTLALAALVGCAARNAVEYLHAPAWLVAIFAFAALVLVWDRLHVWMPPAGALMLLAFLAPWPGPWTYFVEATIGAAVWVVVAVYLFPGIRPGVAGAPAEKP